MTAPAAPMITSVFLPTSLSEAHGSMSTPPQPVSGLAQKGASPPRKLAIRRGLRSALPRCLGPRPGADSI